MGGGALLHSTSFSSVFFMQGQGRECSPSWPPFVCLCVFRECLCFSLLMSPKFLQSAQVSQHNYNSELYCMMGGKFQSIWFVSTGVYVFKCKCVWIISRYSFKQVCIKTHGGLLKILPPLGLNLIEIPCERFCHGEYTCCEYNGGWG